MPRIGTTTPDTFLKFDRQTRAMGWINRARKLQRGQDLHLIPGDDFPATRDLKLVTAAVYGAATKMGYQGKVHARRDKASGGIRIIVDPELLKQPSS